MGFEPDEAAANVEQRQGTLTGFEATGDLFNRAPVLLETVDTAPDLSGLESAIAERVKVETQPDGSVTVSVQGDIPEELEERLIAAVKPERQAAVRAAVHRQNITHRNSIAPPSAARPLPFPACF